MKELLSYLKPYSSINSRIVQAEERISEVEDQLNEIKREGKTDSGKQTDRLDTVFL